MDEKGGKKEKKSKEKARPCGRAKRECVKKGGVQPAAMRSSSATRTLWACPACSARGHAVELGVQRTDARGDEARHFGRLDAQRHGQLAEQKRLALL